MDKKIDNTFGYKHRSLTEAERYYFKQLFLDTKDKNFLMKLFYDNAIVALIYPLILPILAVLMVKYVDNVFLMILGFI